MVSLFQLDSLYWYAISLCMHLFIFQTRLFALCTMPCSPVGGCIDSWAASSLNEPVCKCRHHQLWTRKDKTIEKHLWAFVAWLVLGSSNLALCGELCIGPSLKWTECNRYSWSQAQWTGGFVLFPRWLGFPLPWPVWRDVAMSLSFMVIIIMVIWLIISRARRFDEQPCKQKYNEQVHTVYNRIDWI